MNTIHLLMLEQLRYRRERLRRTLDRFEHSRSEFLNLMHVLRQRRDIRRDDAACRCAKPEATHAR